MREVTVSRDALLEILRTNREEHRRIYEEAMEGYREEVSKELRQRLAQVAEGEEISHRIKVPKPEDHTDSYDRAIRMLEMSVEDEVELDELRFAQLVMDEWEWKEGFTRTASNYTAV